MPDRFERLTNLVATLLDTRRPLTLEELIERVPGYPPEGESARRQFERDKDALRGLGIPLRLEHDAFGDQVGYRIDPGEYELPELDLTPEERAALHTAVTAVQLEGGEGREALWKLGGLGGGDSPMLGALPNVPTLPALTDASRRRAAVEFAYRGVERHLEPYAVVFRSGNWYVVGHDRDRDELRSFRADRIEGAVRVGEEGAFERPVDFDPDQLLREGPWQYGEQPPLEAVVAVDDVVADWVVQEVGDASVVEQGATGATIRLTVTNRAAFRSFVLGLLDHAEVLEPEELREDLLDWLRAIVRGGEAS